MKHIITLFILLSIFSNSIAQVDEITPTSLELKGKVKSMSESNYDIKGKIDNLGKMKIKKKKYSYSYYFSEKQLISMKTTSFFDDDSKDSVSVAVKEIDIYDVNGNLVKELEAMGYNNPIKTTDDWDSNVGLVEYYHSYDYAEKKLIAKNHVDVKEKTNNVERKYIYDSNGKLIKVKQFSDHGKDTNGTIKETYIYNKDGWKEEYILYNYWLQESERMKYDSKGNLIYKKYYIGNTKDDYFREISYTYNDKGQIVKEEEKETKAGVEGKATIRTNTYNDKGDLEETVSVAGDGTKLTWKYIYKYDSNNNWINCYSYNTNSTDISIFKRRVIRYY